LTNPIGRRGFDASIPQPVDGSQTVQLTFLGKVSESGESPTLYATDRDSYTSGKMATALSKACA